MYRIHRSETDTTKTHVIENNADMSALLKSGLLIKDIPRATAIAKLAIVAPIYMYVRIRSERRIDQ
jgi:hypothetical protein